MTGGNGRIQRPAGLGEEDLSVIPIGDDNSSRRIIPWVTWGLIAVNFIVFFMELAFGEPFIVQWAFTPRRFLVNPAGDFITVFSAMFMHGGWLHLLSNMLYLWIFGDNVEDRLGHIKFLVFYLLCGIVATFAQFIFSMDSGIPNLGASGAIAGVLGAYLVMFPRGRVSVLLGYGIIPLPALMVIGLWFLLQLFAGFGSLGAAGDTGGVAYMAHVGGFIAGLALAFLIGRSQRLPRWT
jgi:membrane associated rhomboid family serine protease